MQCESRFVISIRLPARLAAAFTEAISETTFHTSDREGNNTIYTNLVWGGVGGPVNGQLFSSPLLLFKQLIFKMATLQEDG